MTSKHAFSFVAFLISALLHVSLWALFSAYKPEKKAEPVKKIPLQVSLFKQVVRAEAMVKTEEKAETKILAPPTLSPATSKLIEKQQDLPQAPVVKKGTSKTKHASKPKIQPKPNSRPKAKKTRKVVKKESKRKPSKKIRKSATKKVTKRANNAAQINVKKNESSKKLALKKTINAKVTTQLLPKRPVHSTQKPSLAVARGTNPKRKPQAIRAESPPKTVNARLARATPPSSQKHKATQPALKPHVNLQLEKQYGRTVQQRIEQQKRYPHRAKRMHKQGVVKVSFSLNKRGIISSLRIVQSSGTTSLDKATLQAIKKVGRFPAFPAGIAKQSIHYVIPIAYRLN